MNQLPRHVPLGSFFFAVLLQNLLNNLLHNLLKNALRQVAPGKDLNGNICRRLLGAIAHLFQLQFIDFRFALRPEAAIMRVPPGSRVAGHYAIPKCISRIWGHRIPLFERRRVPQLRALARSNPELFNSKRGRKVERVVFIRIRTGAAQVCALHVTADYVEAISNNRGAHSLTGGRHNRQLGP